MARRRRAQTRKINADPIYGSDIISKFINKLMYDGKRVGLKIYFIKLWIWLKIKREKKGLTLLMKL